MKALLRYLNLLDWAVASVTLALGIYWSSGWVIAGGVFGLCMAWYKPADRIKGVLEKKLLRKKGPRDDTAANLAEDEFYAKALASQQDVAPAPANPPQEAPQRASVHTGYASVTLSQSKHNVLKPAFLNLYKADSSDGWC